MSMHRSWLLVPLVLAAAAAMWWSLRESLPDASPPQSVGDRASPVPELAVEPPATQRITVDPQVLQMQVFAGPPLGGLASPYLLGDEIDALHARASAGDLKAMLQLGTGLHACLSNWRDPDARKPYQLLQAELQHNASGARPRAESDRESHDRYARAMARHVDCMAIGRERASTGLGWLERAARAGDIEAKTAFARMALDENAYADDGAIYADLDEVIRRRDLADAWIRDAIASGERSALAAIANGGEHMVRNLRDRALYSAAWSLVLQRDFGGDAFTRMVQENLQRDMYLQSGQDWVRDDAAWNTFEAEARRIAEHTSPLPPEHSRRPLPRDG